MRSDKVTARRMGGISSDKMSEHLEGREVNPNLIRITRYADYVVIDIHHTYILADVVSYIIIFCSCTRVRLGA